METNGYLAGETMKTGRWTIENNNIVYYQINKLSGLFLGLGALGGALNSKAEKEALRIDINSIINVSFVKFRLNNKCLLIQTEKEEYKIILDEPQKWLDYLINEIQKRKLDI